MLLNKLTDWITTHSLHHVRQSEEQTDDKNKLKIKSSYEAARLRFGGCVISWNACVCCSCNSARWRLLP